MPSASSSSYWSGYCQETPRRFRKGRRLVEFSQDGLHALVSGPEGFHQVAGAGARLLLATLLEETHESAGIPGTRPAQLAGAHP